MDKEIIEEKSLLKEAILGRNFEVPSLESRAHETRKLLRNLEIYFEIRNLCEFYPNYEILSMKF